MPLSGAAGGGGFLLAPLSSFGLAGKKLSSVFTPKARPAGRPDLAYVIIIIMIIVTIIIIIVIIIIIIIIVMIMCGGGGGVGGGGGGGGGSSSSSICLFCHVIDPVHQHTVPRRAIRATSNVQLCFGSIVRDFLI